ncbi:hypothetical protein SGRIM119S_02432 [Streptomyces griseorubiginosus]
MSTVIGGFRRTAVMAAVMAAALGAVLVPQAQAHAAGGPVLEDPPSFCDNPPPWVTDC